MMWLFYLLTGILFTSFYTTVDATTKTQDAAMQACLQYSHAKDVVRYCAAKRGTKAQQQCVARAGTKQAQRACVVGKGN